MQSTVCIGIYICLWLPVLFVCLSLGLSVTVEVCVIIDASTTYECLFSYRRSLQSHISENAAYSTKVITIREALHENSINYVVFNLFKIVNGQAVISQADVILFKWCLN